MPTTKTFHTFSFKYLGLKYRASKDIYEKNDKFIEKLSEYLDFAIVKVSLPLIMLPKCIGSYFTYLTTDSGSDSFELPIPMW